MLHLLTQPQEELQLNLRINNTQDCQKIELCGSLISKDLKKPHSSRRVGGAEMQSQYREVRRCGVVWRGGSRGIMGSPTFTCGG